MFLTIGLLRDEGQREPAARCWRLENLLQKNPKLQTPAMDVKASGRTCSRPGRHPDFPPSPLVRTSGLDR